MAKLVKIRTTTSNVNSPYLVTIPKSIAFRAGLDKKLGGYLLVRYLSKSNEILLTPLSDIDDVDELNKDDVIDD